MKKLFCVSAGKYDSKRDFDVYRPASLDKPKNNAVMFVNEKNVHRLNRLDLVKDCIIFYPVGCSISKEVREKNVTIEAADPRTAYCLFYRENNIRYLPEKEKYKSVDGALIAEDAIIGSDTVVMPFAYIGGAVTIGKSCYVGCGSRLVGEITIGDNVIIRENTVIGADGLSTDRDSDGRAATMPQFGGVQIENDVQIGANCVVARGAIDDTIIKRGSKIDNSTFISHNVVIGEDTFIVGETIMFGGSSAGDRVFISGNSTIRNKISIGDDATVGMGSNVVKNVESGTIVLGNPAQKSNQRRY